MFEAFAVSNFLLVKSIGSFAFSIILAELYERFNIKIVFTLQRGVKQVAKRVTKVSKEMGKKGSSGTVLSLGQKIFHLHHSRLGLLLIGASVIFSSVSLLIFSLGLVTHHFVRDLLRDKKKLF